MGPLSHPTLPPPFAPRRGFEPPFHTLPPNRPKTAWADRNRRSHHPAVASNPPTKATDGHPAFRLPKSPTTPRRAASPHRPPTLRICHDKRAAPTDFSAKKSPTPIPPKPHLSREDRSKKQSRNTVDRSRSVARLRAGPIDGRTQPLAVGTSTDHCKAGFVLMPVPGRFILAHQTTARADGDIPRAPCSHRDPSGHWDRSAVTNTGTPSAFPRYLDDARQGESSRHAPTHSIQSP